MLSTPKGLNMVSQSIPELLVLYCWFPYSFPKPVVTCSHLGAGFSSMEQDKKGIKCFSLFCVISYWVVFTHPREDSCFPELPFALTIPVESFLVVVYVQQNKSLPDSLSDSSHWVMLLFCVFAACSCIYLSVPFLPSSCRERASYPWLYGCEEQRREYF